MHSGFLGGGVGPVALKRRRASDWWQVAGQTCVAAYQPIGAASLAASYVNLANPGTYDAAPGVAPTLVAGGWSFAAASSQYLTTKYNYLHPGTIIVRFSGAALTAIARIFGINVDNLSLNPNNVSGVAWTLGGTLTYRNPPLAAGILAIAGNQPYRNGAVDGLPISGSMTTGNVIIGMRSDNSRYFTGTIAAIAIYSTTLSAADVAALTTRMQALT